MDYEKKYKEALERASKLRVQNPFDTVSQMMEHIFPELKESEDERIRKELLESFKYQQRESRTDKEWLNGIKLSEVVAWLDKQGERKPVDKVEPKFHEGDWVVYKNDICQIVKREEGCNKLVTTFGIEKELVNERNLSTARLWTIQEAKDGDVLVASEGSIFIFAGVVDCACKYYVALTTNNDIKINKEVEGGYWETSRAVHPATKEQRDLLFSKMKEAGYEWDEDKKEPKKIEQKPKFEVGDEISKKHNSDINKFGRFPITCITDGKYWYNDHVICDISEQDDWELVEQNPAKWSEEDEKNWIGVIDEIEANKANAPDYDIETYDRFLSWLKSIKQRIGG